MSQKRKRKERKTIEDLINGLREQGISEETTNLILQAHELIVTTRLIDKLAFRLAFIYVNDGVNSDKALMMLKEMINKGLITEGQLERIIKKVKSYSERL